MTKTSRANRFNGFLVSAEVGVDAKCLLISQWRNDLRKRPSPAKQTVKTVRVFTRFQTTGLKPGVNEKSENGGFAFPFSSDPPG